MTEITSVVFCDLVVTVYHPKECDDSPELVAEGIGAPGKIHIVVMVRCKCGKARIVKFSN